MTMETIFYPEESRWEELCERPRTDTSALEAVCREIFDHVLSPVLEKESTHDFRGKEGDTEKELVHILYHIRENEIPRILKGESGDEK